MTSFIYKLTIQNLTYYGSSSQLYLSNKLANHRCRYNDYMIGKHTYCSSVELFKLGEPNITLVENCSKEVLLEREVYYITNFNWVNKNLPIKLNRNEKINCKCGGKYTRRNQARHMKSKFHKNNIN